MPGPRWRAGAETTPGTAVARTGDESLGDFPTVDPATLQDDLLRLDHLETPETSRGEIDDREVACIEFTSCGVSTCFFQDVDCSGRVDLAEVRSLGDRCLAKEGLQAFGFKVKGLRCLELSSSLWKKVSKAFDRHLETGFQLYRPLPGLPSRFRAEGLRI